MKAEVKVLVEASQTPPVMHVTHPLDPLRELIWHAAADAELRSRACDPPFAADAEGFFLCSCSLRKSLFNTFSGVVIVEPAVQRHERS
jgi:hypothetical protein